MRINQFAALATGLSRRRVDQLIAESRLTVNGRVARLGESVDSSDVIKLDSKTLKLPAATVTVALNKPPGFVVSRAAQYSRTVYELLPAKYHSLKPVGRLDKDSSGLLLLTNDGELANRLTHPSYAKTKLYKVTLNKPLTDEGFRRLSSGINLTDGPSRLKLTALTTDKRRWLVELSEGRNRQIRRSFKSLGYDVVVLHRKAIGPYQLGQLKPKQFVELKLSDHKNKANPHLS